jgi:ribose transport system substrate-binding protein
MSKKRFDNLNKGKNQEKHNTAEVAPTASGNVNQADFNYVGDPAELFGLNDWFAESGVEADVVIRNPGAVKVPDEMTTPLPTAAKPFRVGFGMYYTADELASMIFESMKTAALEAGVELLLNDANYDQAVQDKAVDDWINQKVHGVILAPCDFTGVKASLDALKEADIPVVTLNTPLVGSIDSAVISESVEQGRIAGQLLVDSLEAADISLKGSVIYQTLPFVHPNALTRAKGFVDVFADYPDIKIVELTGISPEEHSTAFDEALKDHPDIIGAWGLYSAATIGMMEARKTNKRDDILLSSVDNDKPILQGIYHGDVVGTAAYSAVAPARWCMSQMTNLLNGAQIPGIVFYANMAITADNVESAFEHYYPGETLQEYLEGSPE